MSFIIDKTPTSHTETISSSFSAADELLKFKQSLELKKKSAETKPAEQKNASLAQAILAKLKFHSSDKVKDKTSYVQKRDQLNEAVQNAKKKNRSNAIKQDVKKALAKSQVLTPDFEKLHSLPIVSKRALKKERQLEKEKTKGKKWYGMPATEMTEEVKRDLEVLQMRSVLDPKHFYKKNDLKVLPKYFQVGTVMDSPVDFYSNRLSNKERKRTIVDELLADAEFQKYNKRKYKEIIEEKQKTHYKAWRKAKKLKKKK